MLNWPQTSRQSSIVDRGIHCRIGRSACPFDCICSRHHRPQLPFDTLPLYGGCPHHSSWSTVQDKCLIIIKCKHMYKTCNKLWQTSGLCSHINPRLPTAILPLTKMSTPSHPGYSLHGNLPYHQVCADHYSSGHQPSASCHLCGLFWHSKFQGYDIQGRTGLCTHSYEPHATCINRDRSKPCQHFQMKWKKTGLVLVGTKAWLNW